MAKLKTYEKDIADFNSKGSLMAQMVPLRLPRKDGEEDE
jgi:hypothetical protein